MHARIQTWFPFPIQICLNGREWLARSMDAAGLGYVRRDNCFIWLQDPSAAQRLMDRQVQAAWPDLLNGIARQPEPAARDDVPGLPDDVLLVDLSERMGHRHHVPRPARCLARLYPRLVQHGLTTFLSPDVMRFLGRNIPPTGNLPPRCKAEVVSDMKRRPEGVRIKHRLGENSIKMYDKQGSVLRVETTINDAAGSRHSVRPKASPRPSRVGTACARGSPICIGARRSRRPPTTATCSAQASVENTTPLGELAARLCRPVKRNGRRVRALNPHAPGDATLIEAISRGEFTINGFRNRDLRQLLFTGAAMSRHEQRRQARRSRASWHCCGRIV